MKITIEGRPASKKNSKRVFCRGNRPIVLPSKAYERFRETALEQILTNSPAGGRQRFTKNVKVRLFFWQKGKLSQDIDNAITSAVEILADAGIIEDDKQVVKIEAEKMGGHIDWRTEIEVEEV